MWCEEIDEKNAELTRGSTWGFCISDQRPIKHYLTAIPSGCVPLPQIPRTDRQMDLQLQLLSAYYAAPADFRTRCGLYPMAYAAVRAWLFRNMASPSELSSMSYLRTHRSPPTAIADQLKAVAIRALSTPAGAGVTAGSTYNSINATEDVIAALCEIVIANGVLDTVAWSLLWVWAYGGHNGQALIRTRSYAIQALGAIAQRNPQLVGGAQAARNIATLSEQIQHGTAPKTYAEVKERQAFAVTASLAAGSIAAAGVPIAPELLDPRAFLPPGVPPPGSGLPVWIPILGALGAVSLLAGVVVVLTRPRSTDSRRRLTA